MALKVCTACSVSLAALPSSVSTGNLSPNEAVAVWARHAKTSDPNPKSAFASLTTHPRCLGKGSVCICLCLRHRLFGRQPSASARAMCWPCRDRSRSAKNDKSRGLFALTPVSNRHPGVKRRAFHGKRFNGTSRPTQRAPDWWESGRQKELILRLSIFLYNEPCPRPPTCAPKGHNANR